MSLAQKPAVAEKLSLMQLRKVTWSWHQIGLGATLILSAFLNLFQLDQNGYTNEYYAAAVRSQLANWHNFFYNAFDPGGFITIDKPPVAFWFETASAWVFGFSGVSILLPSAIAGVLSVALVYDLVKRAFGPAAGLLAAFALAVTPIAVIMDRHNNPESLLILSLVLAAWGISRATEKGKLGWLIFAVAMVGVGFNIKMLEAFIVLPGFYLLYLLLAPVRWWKRLVHLTLATVVLAVVSLSWAVAVELTPANQRPYVGGSQNNSVFNLILDYNGLGRVDGNEMGGPGGQFGGGQPPAGFTFPGQPGATGNIQNGNSQNANGGFQNRNRQNSNSGAQTGNRSNSNTGNNGTQNGNPPGTNGGFPNGNGNNRGFPGGGPGGGGPGGGVVAGQAGPFRMFDPQLAGEEGWLLPLALLGIAVVGIQSWRRFPPGKERSLRLQSVVLWGSWLLTFMVVFSMAKGIFHSYYLVMLAPAVAALVGASVEGLWHSYRQGGWQRWLLPVALIGSAVFELNILGQYNDWNRTIAIVMAGIELICAGALLAIPSLFRRENPRLTVGVVTLALAGLLIAPVAWTIHAILNKTFTNATLPTAVPAGGTANRQSGFGFGFGANNNPTNALVKALQTNWNSWLSGLVIGLVVLVALVLAIRLLRRYLGEYRRLDRVMTVATMLVVITLGLSLTLTALPPAAAASSGSTAAPSTGMIGNPSMELSDTSKLIAFLEANRNGSTYLLATTSSQNASPLIIKTGQPIMALGGFMGSDKTVTSQQLAEMVQNNTVRYFLLDGMRMGGSQQSLSWIQQNCKVVDSQLWSSSSSTTTNQSPFGNFGGRGGGSSGQLYDCAPQS